MRSLQIGPAWIDYRREKYRQEGSQQEDDDPDQENWLPGRRKNLEEPSGKPFHFPFAFTSDDTSASKSQQFPRATLPKY